MAQAGRGGALLTDTITLNPSLLGFQPIQAASGTFNWADNAQSPDASKNRTYNLSVVDGRNQYVSAGVSYTRLADKDVMHMGLAKRLMDSFSIGASVKRFSTRSEGASVSGYDGGLSVSYAVAQDPAQGQTQASASSTPLQIGLTVDNLRHLARDEQYFGPKQVGGGVKVNLSNMLLLYGDVVENFPSKGGAWPSYFSGTEVAVGSDVYVRGGLFGFREKGWSAGGGWVGPKIGLSYGYQNKHVQADRSFQHSVTMDLFM